MTSAFENETIDHCLTAYQHHIDYGKDYLISPQQKKNVRLQKLFALFFGSQKLLFWRREATTPSPPPTGHAYFVNFNKCLCDTSVLLKLNV